MDAVLDRALALRGVTGVLVLTRDSWLTIASRGALTANDAPAIEQLLSWTEEDSTGSVPWFEVESGRCLHFHRTDTHTLILLRQFQQQQRPSFDSRISHGSADHHTGSGPNLLSPPRPPYMRFRWSSTSSNNSENTSSFGFGLGLRAGSASLFAPSRSADSSHQHNNVHRPSSWY